jgi:hypothetical protein
MHIMIESLEPEVSSDKIEIKLRSPMQTLISVRGTTITEIGIMDAPILSKIIITTVMA